MKKTFFGLVIDKMFKNRNYLTEKEMSAQFRFLGSEMIDSLTNDLINQKRIEIKKKGIIYNLHEIDK